PLYPYTTLFRSGFATFGFHAEDAIELVLQLFQRLIQIGRPFVAATPGVFLIATTGLIPSHGCLHCCFKNFVRLPTVARARRQSINFYGEPEPIVRPAACKTAGSKCSCMARR